jgi:hypothetical protein
LRNVRTAAVQKGADQCQQLLLADGAASQGVVHGDMVREGGGVLQDLEELRIWIDCGSKPLHVAKIPESLYASRCGAGTYGDQASRLLPDPEDAFGIFRGGDGAFHQGDVVRRAFHFPRCFEKNGDAQLATNVQELILTIEEGKLTAVA